MKRLLFFIPLLAALSIQAQPGEQRSPHTGKMTGPQNEQAQQWLQDSRTAGFVENKGQLLDQDGKSNPAVKYLLNMQGLNVQLRSTGFSYDAWVEDKAKQGARKFHRVDIGLDGANPHAVLVAGRPSADAVNVISAQGSFSGIHSYQAVTYKEIYPGIDLEFVAKKGSDKPVEYNFIVHPGADASKIRMKYNSGSEISLKDGMIEMDLAFGKLKERIPASYTQQDGSSLAVQYKPLDETANLYAFNVPDYDHRKTLVIDPTPQLVWATYYGGTSADQVQYITADAVGNIYISGATVSPSNIATTNTYQTTHGGGTYDFFMAKFTGAGIRLWGTYVGGTLAEGSIAPNVSPTKVAIDGNFVYLAGAANSSGLASASGVHQSALMGGADAYLGKFNTVDGTRVWATYYGGTGDELPFSLFVHSDGSIYLSGYTASTTGIASTGAVQTTFGGNTTDGFIARFTSSGTFDWGTYVGGAGLDRVMEVVTDAAGNVYATGCAGSSTGISTPGSFQPALGGGSWDIFLLKLNSTGTAKLWGTYFGGSSTETGYALKMDPTGNLFVVATSGTPTNVAAISTGLATPGALYTTPPGGLRDMLIAKFDTSGNRLWSTYYGGTGNDMGIAADLDEQGNIIIVGDGVGPSVGAITGTPSTDLPITNCTYQTSIAGLNEAFISKIAADGGSVLWGTYFGGPSDDRCVTVKYLGNGNFLVGGVTNSTSGITTSGVYQTTYSGVSGVMEGYFARFSEGMAPSDVKVTATILNPMTQTACALGIPNTIVGNAASLYNPPGFTSPIFYQWQTANSATGPWTDMSGEVFRDLQPLSSQTARYYRRLILVNNGYCDTKVVDSSATASVMINGNNAPIANANGPQWYVCGSSFNSISLTASATGGSGVYSSYQWYAGSNLTTPAFTGANYNIGAVSATTTYTLKVTDNAGCIDVDQVTVAPVIANAGPDVSYCEGSGGVQIGTTGVPGGSVTYSWITVSGSPVSSLSCTSCAQPIAQPTQTTTYRVTTTVTRKGGATCSTTDDVTVTYVAAPTGGASFGGTDKTICKNTPVVLGGVNDGAATYSWAPTSYLNASNVYNPTFDAGTNKVVCPLVYTVSAAKGGCIFTDQVSVTVIDPSTSLDGQTTTCQSWSSGNSNNCTGATYSWQLVSGPGVTPTGASLRNSGADAYLVNTGSTNAVYQRVTTVNGVSCTSGPVTISPCGSGGGAGCPLITINLLSPQGCPKVFGQQDLQLYATGVNAADYNFSWTPTNIVDNPTAPSVNITSTAAATINLTVTNKYTGQVCTAPPLPINNPAWSLPVLNVSNKTTCSGTPVTIGEPTAAGFTYAWTPATGLNSTVVGNPLASVSLTSSFSVTKTDNANGCKTRSTVTVTVADINFDAGTNRAVCNGATVTLGTTPGGSYTYSWTPVGAAWTNGTGPTNANPQVLFAGSSQTFNVTVTDPLTGCQKTDAVTLTGTVAPGEYAGAAVGPLCPGETAQLGRAAEPGATYMWSPATGLSCTTCANPTATAGAASQSYSVTVSYIGCSIPATDNVTVSVNSLPAVTLTDKTVCPSTPTNIGIGGTGNTASLASVSSYEWSPATGLSCTNCASPNANPVATTTYNVLITFTNGCTLQKSVVITPGVQATAKPDATICPGGSVVLGSPAVANVTYSWSVLSGTGGSVTPTNIAQPTANPTVTSVYRLTATGTGPNAGCTVTDDVTITVKALPTFDITGTTAVCTGGSTTLMVSPVATNMIYQWSPTTGVTTPDSFTTTIHPVATTTYRVTQTDLNSGCSDYKEAVVTVWPNNVTATGGEISVCPASSAVMPLTVTPATGNTITWSPATYLSNAFIQNPVIAPQGSGTYIATVINNTSNCIDTALVTVTVPASCLASDFGDAPAVYENGTPASHGIITTLKIGAVTDAEGAPESAAMNAMAVGDDDNNQINDEEGISFLPQPGTATTTLGVVVNNVLNNTGSPAYLVGWIDFNRDGDFNDAGERSQAVNLASATGSYDPVLQFSGFNTGCVVKAGLSYLRVRLTTDTTGKWATAPAANGSRTDGEVEDYAITLMGADFGDAPAAYPAVRASVFPDLNADGKPDATGSVWLGNRVDYDYSCSYAPSSNAMADDNDYSIDDEDGLQMSNQVPIGQPVPWTLTVNSQGPVSGVQWGMWIDWNADGTFDNFYNGNVNTASPTPVTVNVTAPSNAIRGFVVRTGVKPSGTAFTAVDFNSTITNGEWEDYIRITPLPVTLLYFNAMATGCNGEVTWATSREHNADYFEVEQSMDGISWQAVKQVKATGTSTIERTYTASIKLNAEANNYVRLKMVDKDGGSSYSMLRVLRCDDRLPILIWPNPATTQVQISGLPQGGSISVTDATGKQVMYKVNTSKTELLMMELLTPGAYQLSVYNESGLRIDVQSLIKQ